MDLSAEIRAREIEIQALEEKCSRLKRRLAARLGLALFVLLIGRALGGLVADGAHWFVVASITAWGCWGLHHLITRH